MHNAAMVRWIKLLALVLLVFVAVVFVALVGLQYWLGTADFRSRVQAIASEAAGVEVAFDRLVVDPWPIPGVAALGIRVQTAAPITAHRVEVRPAWRALLRGRLALTSLHVEGAEVPQAGIDEWMERRERRQAAAKKGAEPGPSAEVLAMLPRRVDVERLRWLRKGAEPLAIDARLRLDAVDHAPQSVDVKVLEGAWRDAHLQLERRAAQTWDFKLNLAGGTVKGPVQLERVGALWQLKGSLETAGVETGRLGSGKLSGKLEASTALQGQAKELAVLAQALQTQSTFTVRDAVVHGVDLARAVKTVGLSRGGQTPLDTLAGQVTTRGAALALNNLVASSGVLAATGNLNVAAGSRALTGRIVVRLGSGLAGEVAGIPLVLGGTLDKPELSLTRGALLGATVGTLVMPGVGTGAGANLGDRVGSKLKGLFGN